MAYISKHDQVISNKPKKKKKSKHKVKTPRPEGEYICACGCGCTKYLSIHHVYNKSARNFSSRNNCVEWLCWNAHQSSTGIHGTHSDGKLDLQLRQKHQLRLENDGMSRSEFIRQAGKNYL